MNGKWITCDSKVETPMFRKKFTLNRVQTAGIDICGLGYFTLIINGKKVGNDMFVPALSDYRERDFSKFLYPLYDKISHRVYYMYYGITEYLKKGENTVDVIVGNGWYRQTKRAEEGEMSFDDSLLAAFDITLINDDNSETHILTDGSEQCFVYPIIESNLFYGETTDTRMFLSDLAQTPVLLSDFEPEQLIRQHFPCDKVVRRITPKAVGSFGNVTVYDSGENISGTVKLRVKGENGEKLTLKFAEELENGRLWFVSAGGDSQIQQDTFILNGCEQEIEPMFVFHGFRYFEVEGDAKIIDLQVQVIHSNIPVTATFSCDNEIINWLYDAYIRTQLDNIHGCVPSDCPHRERLGYTGDGQSCAEAAMLTLDSKEMYRKWIDDIIDCQDINTGHIQHTAPFMGGGGGPGGWGCAIVLVPYQYYIHFRDISVLKKAYIPMKRWLSYMIIHCKNNLLSSEEEKGWCLGEWATPEKLELPEDFVNTCFMIKSLYCMTEISKLLKKDEQSEYYSMFTDCANALCEKYYKDGQYLGGVQGADAFACYANLPHSEDLPQKIYERYNSLQYLDTGMFGTDILCHVLFQNNMGDLAIKLLASENTETGFNYMKSRGATTLYEYTNKYEPSHNHPMFGACVRNLFTGLLGISSAGIGGGFSEVVIAPALNTEIKHAKGSICTEYGKLEVEFNTENETVISVTVPKEMKVTLRYGVGEYQLETGENIIKI